MRRERNTGKDQDSKEVKARQRQQRQNNRKLALTYNKDVTVWEEQVSGGRGFVLDSCFLPWYIALPKMLRPG
jgi:hypothetical protein